MPGKERSVLSEREEMVARYRNGAPVARLARDDAVSRKTIRKWIGRATSGADDALGDRSRRPHAFPRRTPEPVRLQVLELAQAHPTWGGRKLHHALRNQGQEAVPAPSTISKLLRQDGRLRDTPTAPTAWTRFAAAAPNDLWQLDFKGGHALRQGNITPLTLLDDHRRYLLEVQGLQALTLLALQPILPGCFQRYGLPWAILCDNGPPWGTSERPAPTRFAVWCMQLDIWPVHGRPHHPQPQGKLERLHRTLKADGFAGIPSLDLATAQVACDAFRRVSNHDRPHEALGHQPPASRDVGSERTFPTRLAKPEYAPDTACRTVARQGTIG
ncbi:MAG: helix-turn-helix domain-containing protein [Thermomicrobiales bacterium]